MQNHRCTLTYSGQLVRRLAVLKMKQWTGNEDRPWYVCWNEIVLLRVLQTEVYGGRVLHFCIGLEKRLNRARHSNRFYISKWIY